MFIEGDQLEDRINNLREELIHIAEKTGLNSYETLCVSQELDQLIILKIKDKRTEWLETFRSG